MTEQWRPYEDHPIEVSDRGRVRSLAWGRRRVMRLWKNQGGYLQVGWRRNGVRYVSTVHRLVLLCWVGPRPAGMEAQWRDGDRANNRASNLCWARRPDREGAGMRSETASLALELVAAGGSYREVAEIVGVTSPAICGLVRGRSHRDLPRPEGLAAALAKRRRGGPRPRT